MSKQKPSGHADLKPGDYDQLVGQPELTQKSSPDGGSAGEGSDLEIGMAAGFDEPAATGAYAPKMQAGVVVAGRYRLLEEIGEGGMGTVFVAQQSEPVKRKVALKLIKIGMDSRAVLARFEAERQALALMDHPNIAKVLDGGLTDSGRPFFVMEYVKGVPITEYCDTVRLSIDERLQLFTQVCSAVQHAHQKGIIHRDLKPSNILVAPYDDKAVPKVIDFGLAKAMHQSLTDMSLYTGHETVLGTPLYMSPEQAQLNNIDIDTRADVYSLGVLLYELLTGTTPLERKRFREAAWDEVRRIIREEEPPRPSMRLSSAETLPSLAACRHAEPAKLTHQVRGDLDWIVMKALEKDRTRRYETANGFAADVQRYLSGEAVMAHPPSTRYRLKKFVRKHRAQVIAGSLLLLALLTGIAGTTFGLLRAEAQRRLAVEEKQKAERSEQVAQTEKDRAIEFKKMAMDALRATTDEDVRKILSGKPVIGPNERTYLEAIIERWKKFSKVGGDDEQARAMQAEGHSRVGLLRFHLGHNDEALHELETALKLWQQLAADFPNEPDCLYWLGGDHVNLGLVLVGLGKHEGAEEQYRKALIFLEKLEAEYPDFPGGSRFLANCHNNLGQLLETTGQWAQVEQHYLKAMTIREKLVTQFPVDPEYRSNFASSQTSLARLMQALKKWQEAEQHFCEAVAIQKKLVGDFPDEPDYRYALGGSHVNLGLLLEILEKHEEAEDQYRTALVILEKLTAEFPGKPSYWHFLGNCRFNMGLLLKVMERWTEVEEQYRQALAVREKLAIEFPTVPKYRSDQARVHGSLGNLLSDKLQNPREAEEQYLRAVAIREKLADDFSSDTFNRIELGGGYCNLGLLFEDRDTPDDSLEWFAKAIAMLSSIYEQDASLDRAKEYLCNSFLGRAMTYDHFEMFEQAAKDWGRVIELSSPSKQSQHRLKRMISCTRGGLYVEAILDAEELAKLPDLGSDNLYNFACVYAVASEEIPDKQQEYADRAMELLHLAVEAGFRDAEHINQDTDLDALRYRDVFKSLLEELEGTESGKVIDDEEREKR